jgi:hypothetical protein
MNPVGKRAYNLWCCEMAMWGEPWERLSDREQAAWEAVGQMQLEKAYFGFPAVTRCGVCQSPMMCSACERNRPTAIPNPPAKRKIKASK